LAKSLLTIPALLVAMMAAQGELLAQTEAPSPGDKALSQALRQILLARAELEFIRLEMGKPEIGPPPLRAIHAGPRQVFSLAQSLLKRSGRFVYEQTLEEMAEPELPPEPVGFGHVLTVATAAVERIHKVKHALGIPEEPAIAPGVAPGTSPAEVFDALLAANRELDQLLDLKFAPRDVFEEVTLAIAYAARLLDSPGEVSTPLEPEPFERCKRPVDVYRRLMGGLDQLRQIGEKSGVPMAALEVDETRVDAVAPGDVHDMAALLAGQLAGLHQRLGKALPPRRVYDPGRKLPSHVFQRAGILASQLEQLRRKVETNPQWLSD